MLGITIGVFSVIGVMTTISALRGSIENGLSFLGSNTFQFSKWPFAGGGGGPEHRKYEMRRNITLAQALRYRQLMEGTADVICLKVFHYSAARRCTTRARRPPMSTSAAPTSTFSTPINMH